MKSIKFNFLFIPLTILILIVVLLWAQAKRTSVLWQLPVSRESSAVQATQGNGEKKWYQPRRLTSVKDAEAVALEYSASTLISSATADGSDFKVVHSQYMTKKELIEFQVGDGYDLLIRIVVKGKGEIDLGSSLLGGIPGTRDKLYKTVVYYFEPESGMIVQMTGENNDETLEKIKDPSKIPPPVPTPLPTYISGGLSK